MVLNFIKPDKTADFEEVVAKLKEALQNSPNATRKEQAASWKVFKSPDPGPAGSVLYVFIIDPVVKGADYTVATILAEAFSGDEFTALDKKYTEAYAIGPELREPVAASPTSGSSSAASDSILRRSGAMASSARRFPA